MPRLIGPAFLTALALASLLALGGGQALANHVQCGDVITQDTTLDSDLIDCPQDGIVIAAHDVTLDLGGHTVDGVSTSFFHGAMGVTRPLLRSSPLLSATIEDGFISDFAIGIEFGNAPGLVVRRVTVSGTGIGIEVDGDGIRIERNSVHDNPLGGVNLFGSSGSVIERNHVVNNSHRGIWVNAGARQHIDRNAVTGSEIGIKVAEGADNVVTRNWVFANVVGISAVDSAYRTRIDANRVYSNARDGIEVACCESTILRNVAAANGDDGIQAWFGAVDDFGPNVVRRNTANLNSDLGIEASEAGVVDGGGNKAARNGNSLQCLNIACR